MLWRWKFPYSWIKRDVIHGTNCSIPTDLCTKVGEVFQIFLMIFTYISLLTFCKMCFPITLKMFWGQHSNNQLKLQFEVLCCFTEFQQRVPSMIHHEQRPHVCGATCRFFGTLHTMILNALIISVSLQWKECNVSCFS